MLAIAQFATMAKQDTELLQVLIRQIGQDAVVYRVIAKRGLVLLKAKAPQPACHVHDTAVLAQACARLTGRGYLSRARSVSWPLLIQCLNATGLNKMLNYRADHRG